MKLQSFNLFICCLFLCFSCNRITQAANIEEDNEQIRQMYLKDIAIRELDAKSDTVNLDSFDKQHREKVFELIAENKIITPRDNL